MMKQSVAVMVVVRLVILTAGFAAITGVVYAAGKWLIPLTSGADRAILAGINPNEYAPGFDQFFRAVSDYVNFLIALPLISWVAAYVFYRWYPRCWPYVAGILAVEVVVKASQGPLWPKEMSVGAAMLLVVSIAALVGVVAYLLYVAGFRRFVPSYKMHITGLLAIETVVVTVMAATGRIWPNSVYTGVNVLLVLGCLVAFSFMTYRFYAMDDDAMRRFAWAFGLVFISIYLTDAIGTNRIKEAIARPRPFSDANKPWNEQVRSIPDEYLRGSNSYPSGHTSGTFGLVTPLFWYARNRKVRGGLLSVGCLQGVSRVYTAAHFPFDVFMGGVLGFVTGTLVFFTLWGRSTWPPQEHAPEVA